MNNIINLRSDTCTLPTDEMRQAMAMSVVGDDTYDEDPTVKRLESLAADILGKEDSLFVSSGTMGNLISLMTHCSAGQEVILEAESHIYYYEVGGMSRVGGLMPRLVAGKNGIMDPDDIKKALREYNLHYPTTGLICLESSHNRGGGTVVPLEYMERTLDLAREQGLPVHLDGARIFNASFYLGVDPKVIASKVDSVMFCLSKGLSAPVGSMLCGTKDFIKGARKIRKLLGGGLRQSGVIAAPGVVALETMIPRLVEDNNNAQRLAEGLMRIPGILIDMSTVQTNMVVFDVSGLGSTAKEFSSKLYEQYRIKSSTRPPYRIRMVTNRHISLQDIDYTIQSVAELAKKNLEER